MDIRNQNQENQFQCTTNNKACQTEEGPEYCKKQTVLSRKHKQTNRCPQSSSRSNQPFRPLHLSDRPRRPRKYRNKPAINRQLNLDLANLKIKNDIAEKEENVEHHNNEILFPRCSTPMEEICFHCSHGHNERCCLYILDDINIGKEYAQWVRNLEYPGTNSIDYLFSHKKEEINRVNLNKCSLPLVWIRQFYYPLLTPRSKHLPEKWVSTKKNYEGESPIMMHQFPQYRYPATENSPDFIDVHESIIKSPICSRLYVPHRSDIVRM